MNLIKQYEAEQQAKLSDGKTIPDFAPGDSLRVNVKVIEGSKERVQAAAQASNDDAPKRVKRVRAQVENAASEPLQQVETRG